MPGSIDWAHVKQVSDEVNGWPEWKKEGWNMIEVEGKVEDLLPCPNPECNSDSVDLMPISMGEYNWTVGCNECAMTGPQAFTNHQAHDKWNALPRQLVYSKHQGFVPAKYWRRLFGHAGIIVDVLNSNLGFYWTRDGFHRYYIPEDADFHRTEWAGPILEPREPEVKDAD